ncbi:IQ calmodulin-binding motif family protein [Trichomonas vaginalis G3]|uniref:non-specific serine/threonine protein kinase n=1 Tax=Trichomonas vaginalis (strain ATCC PRA-98 / G3) TaxID=412133 RepID=A2DAH4_TRIV3|nr:serine/threonine-protein kinase PIM family [Trichomonas vaginalis G3]EAY22477.1 IQ calmodulin-binding motif family protein [Trichomonas vaginalis G3]KAI5497200.1 serine/threonine-protein kinase PIM family [Trichomonas vaginalis G3]|eukprot:XP_001583463.1 IQ calmodulin-binding motif family protein [Trichomonas vaginalis G3]
MELENLNKNQVYILQRFAKKAIHNFKFRKYKCAVKIQRLFRYYLYKKQLNEYIKSRAAIKIQRFWRTILRQNSESEERKRKRKIITGTLNADLNGTGIPHRSKRRFIVPELPPPWKDQNMRKFRDDQIDAMLKERESLYKWAYNLVSSIPKKLFNKFDMIDQIKSKNTEFMNRQVQSNFYLFTPYYRHNIPFARWFYFHEPSYRLFVVCRKSVSMLTIHENETDNESFHIEADANLIDSAFDKYCGRIYLLFDDWTISVFEHGNFIKPKRILSKPTLLCQRKYLYVDKFGYLWLYCGVTRSNYVLLDALTFSPLLDQHIKLPDELPLGEIIPLFTNGNPNGYIVYDIKYSKPYLMNRFWEITYDKFNDYGDENTQIFISKEFLVKYGGNSCYFVIYDRNGENITKRQTIKFESPVISVQYNRRRQLWILGMTNAKIKILALARKQYQVVIPKENIDPKLQPLYEETFAEILSRPKYGKDDFVEIWEHRMISPANYLRVIQFSTTTFLVVTCCTNGDVNFIFMVIIEYPVKAYQVPLMKLPPFFTSPHVICRRIFDEDFFKVYPLVTRSRVQFDRDALYNQQISAEVEKRYNLYRLKSTPNPEYAKIMLQSPYRRWIKYLTIFKDTLSVYELYNIISKTMMMNPSIDTTDKFIHLLISRTNMKNSASVGKYKCLSGLTFNTQDIIIGLEAVATLLSSELKDFNIFRENIQTLDLTFPAFYMKSAANEYNAYVIHRLNEIENIIKNRIKMSGSPPALYLKKQTKFVVIPDIYPEISKPIMLPKLIEKPYGLTPNPLFEAYRYRSHRDFDIPSNNVKYCSYDKEIENAEIIPLKEEIPIDELSINRGMGHINQCPSIVCISKDGMQLMQQYPTGYVPLAYFLESDHFTRGNPQNFLVARYWLMQILIIIGSLHKMKIVLRSCLPSNWIISQDGSTVQLLTLADAKFPGTKPPDLHWKEKFEYFLPPEYFDEKQYTSAFDIYQFGVLLLIIFTGQVPSSFHAVLKKYQKYKKVDIIQILKSPLFYYDPIESLDFHPFPFFTAKNDVLHKLLEIDSITSLFDIVTACLDFDPERRPTVRQLLDHPFFNIPLGLCNRAKANAVNIVHSTPYSIFVSAIFGNLCNHIENELKINPASAPTLLTAVNILDAFINPTDSNIPFPIENHSTATIVNEVFDQEYFDRIVNYVINCLSLRFERGEDVKEDAAFSAVLHLFHQFFRSRVISNDLFIRVFPSFKRIATGIWGWHESHVLFAFLHQQMKPLVDFFFLKLSPDVHKKMGVSEFYCKNFVQFYDNLRDFSLAFEEKSIKRYTSALSFMKIFIEAYRNDDTRQLLFDFGISHKIEQSLVFSIPPVRLAALELCSEMLSFNAPELYCDFIFTTFAYHIESGVQPFAEKQSMIELTRRFMLSKSFNVILSMMRSGIIEALLSCTSSSVPEYSQYTVWGYKEELPIFRQARSALTDIFNNGISSIYAVVINCPDIVDQLESLNIISFDAKNFSSMIKNIETNNVIEPTLITTMSVAEVSPISIVTSMTGQTSQAFQESMTVVAKYLVRTGVKEVSLLKSVISIWENHKWDLYTPLFDFINREFANSNRQDCVHLSLKILQRPTLPESFLTIPKAFINSARTAYEKIKAAVKKRSVDMSIVENYPSERKWRMTMLSAILTCTDRRVPLVLYDEGFADFIIECLNTPVKLEVNLRVVPTSFSNYNRTYQIRNEAIQFIRIVCTKSRHGDSVLSSLVSRVRNGGLLQREADMLRKIEDREYRKTCISLLQVLSDSEEYFNINSIIVNSDFLMELKEETLVDWEKFQILKNAWNKSMDNVINVYGRIKCLYDSIE